MGDELFFTRFSPSIIIVDALRFEFHVFPIHFIIILLHMPTAIIHTPTHR